MPSIQIDEPPSSPETRTVKKIDKNTISDSSQKVRISLAGHFGLAKEMCGRLAFCCANISAFIKSIKFNNRTMPHVAIFFLLLIVVFSNYNEVVKAKDLAYDLVSVDPVDQSQIADTVDSYTPLIQSDGRVVDRSNSTLATKDGFIENNAPLDTQITARVEPLPDNSQKEVAYIIKPGDTLTALAWKFGLKTATLTYVNNIDNSNNIKPGMKITIPKKGDDTPASAIAKRAKDKQAQLASASRNTVARSQTTTKRTYSGSYNGDGGVSLRVPVSYSYISRGVGSGHTGIDYVCNVGTPVYAAADGVVILVSTGWSGGYGNEIVISHGGGIATRYAHLSKISVSAGSTISKGQVVGLSGNSGRSTGPHLHFEKIVNGRWVNFNLR